VEDKRDTGEACLEVVGAVGQSINWEVFDDPGDGMAVRQARGGRTD